MLNQDAAHRLGGRGVELAEAGPPLRAVAGDAVDDGDDNRWHAYAVLHGSGTGKDNSRESDDGEEQVKGPKRSEMFPYESEGKAEGNDRRDDDNNG